MTRTVWIATWIVQIARIVSGIVIRIVRIVIFMFMIVAMMIRTVARMFNNENGDVCNKLELNILKIDQAIAILSSKKIFQKILNFQTKFISLGKIAITRPILYIISTFSP